MVISKHKIAENVLNLPAAHNQVAVNKLNGLRFFFKQVCADAHPKKRFIATTACTL